MRITFSIKVLIALLPLAVACLIALFFLLKNVKDEVLLRRIIKNTSKTMIDTKVAIREDEQKQNDKGIITTFIENQNAKLNIVGITYKYETVLAVAAIVFIISAIASKILFKAGPLLMAYLGLVFAGMVLMGVNKKAATRKEELSVEFLEKINEMSSHLSVGKNIPNAIDDIVKEGQTSQVLLNELVKVKQDISLGKSFSEAFMNVYENLKIDEIKTFAMTLSVYENTGGNLIEVLKANDNFFQNKIKIKNAQKVYITSLKTSQRMTIGIPVAFIAIMVLVNPSFFGDFYSQGIGELVGVFAISVLLLGVYVSNKIAKFK